MRNFCCGRDGSVSGSICLGVNVCGAEGFGVNVCGAEGFGVNV